MRLWCGIVVCLSWMIMSVTPTFAVAWFGSTDKVITNEQKDVIGAEIRNSNDTLRDGTELIAEGVGDADNNDKIYYEEVTTTGEGRDKTLDFVRALMNYALAIIGLIALLYIAYHGFLTLTAAGNDGQAGKGMEGMRYGAMALLGIAVSWFIVSILFWLIQQIT